MRKLFFLVLFLQLTLNVFSQVPQKMSYQSVVRNSSGVLVANSPVKIRISILKGSTSGTAVYVETHSVTTNANGLASLEIGTGTINSGNFSNINWSNSSYFLKTETDPTGGSNYTISGTNQLLSVPYALYAEKAGNSYWKPYTSGIYYNAGRVGIGTTPNPIVPLTILDNNTNGNGNAVLHLKSADTWHTALTMFNGPESSWKYYSFFITGPANSGAVPGTFGLFNHNSTGWTYNVNPTTNNMAIGSDVGYVSKNPRSKLHVFNGDVNIDQLGSGVITKSPDGNCWRITVDNAGRIVTTSIICP